MKFKKTKDVKALGVTFDGWEVLLGGAVVCLIAGVAYAKLQEPLFWAAGVLFVLWIVMVFIANLFLDKRRTPSEGGGAATGPAATNPPAGQQQ